VFQAHAALFCLRAGSHSVAQTLVSL